MAQRETLSANYEPYIPSKWAVFGGAVNALVGDIVVGKLLATKANQHALNIGQSIGVSSPEFSGAVDASVHADEILRLTNVFRANQHPTLTASEAVLPAFIVLGELADPTHHELSEKNTNWLKRFALNTHLVLATGATSFAPAVLADMFTRISEHREVIMSTPEAAILLYATLSLARAGKRMYEYATYPLRTRKANIQNHIAASRAKWKEEITPGQTQVENALTNAKLKNLVTTGKTYVQPALEAVSKVVSSDVERGRLEKIHTLLGPARQLLSVANTKIQPAESNPNDMPEFLQPGANETRQRLAQQKR